MTLLAQKVILVTGVLSERSIAYGIAQACYQQGARLIITYQGERLKERVTGISQKWDAISYPCDVTDPEQLTALHESVAGTYGSLDGIVHSIAYAPREAIQGEFLAGCSREAFLKSQDISTYSFIDLVNTLRSLLNPYASLLTLSYLGAQRAVPGYNTMGLAKASLEAAVRYMAADLGANGTRVNAISAGAIKTTASSGIAGIREMLHYSEKLSLLHRNITIEDVGQAAVFLLSDMSRAITAEILHVDGGVHAALLPIST